MADKVSSLNSSQLAKRGSGTMKLRRDQPTSPSTAPLSGMIGVGAPEPCRADDAGAMVRPSGFGRIDRFAAPEKLVAHIGLDPSVRQSGDGPAHHGRIAKRGRSNARHLLVQAAWQAVRAPGPLRAFHERVRARRGNHVAAVAVARKLVILIWHMLSNGEDHAWTRPALMARKMRALELAGRCAGAARSARRVL